MTAYLRRRIRQFGLTFAIFLLGACGSKSNQAEFQKELKTVISIVATCHRTIEAWHAGALPAPYTHKTLQSMHEQLQKESASIQSMKIDDGSRFLLLQTIESIQNTLLQSISRVQARDQSVISQHLSELDQTKAKLASLQSK